MIDLAFDSLKVLHMGSFAVGIGAAAFLELNLVQRFRSNLDFEGLNMLLLGHDLIKAAVIGLWLSGLGLLFLRLGVLGDPFTAKLGAKLAVVSALTINMVVIERYLIPEILAYEDMGYPDIPLLARLKFGSIAGFSAGAWLSALLLGGIGRFKAMEALTLAEVLLPLLAAATLAGALAAILAGRETAPAPQGSVVPGE